MAISEYDGWLDVQPPATTAGTGYDGYLVATGPTGSVTFLDATGGAKATASAGGAIVATVTATGGANATATAGATVILVAPAPSPQPAPVITLGVRMLPERRAPRIVRLRGHATVRVLATGTLTVDLEPADEVALLALL
jgi:hypothetical protein